MECIADNKIPEANMCPTGVLSAPGGPHVCLMNLAVRDVVTTRVRFGDNE